jgi:hypothetical protein
MLRPTYNTLASEHSGAVEGPNPIVETSLARYTWVKPAYDEPLLSFRQCLVSEPK